MAARRRRHGPGTDGGAVLIGHLIVVILHKIEALEIKNN